MTYDKMVWKINFFMFLAILQYGFYLLSQVTILTMLMVLESTSKHTSNHNAEVEYLYLKLKLVTIIFRLKIKWSTDKIFWLHTTRLWTDMTFYQPIWLKFVLLESGFRRVRKLLTMWRSDGHNGWPCSGGSWWRGALLMISSTGLPGPNFITYLLDLSRSPTLTWTSPQAYAGRESWPNWSVVRIGDLVDSVDRSSKYQSMDYVQAAII